MSDTQGPMIAMCRMDAEGNLTFAGSREAVHALQAAIAERYFRVESGDAQAGDTQRAASDYE